MAGLYLHIPFCRKACHYCDFHFSTSNNLRKEVLLSIVKELKLHAEATELEAFETIYLGGGTPSILSINELNFLFNSIYKHFSIKTSAEITLEANPSDLHVNYLNELKSTPINRLSIGLQSFDEAQLKWMNRDHTALQSMNAVRLASNAGFNTLNVDLIYGIPETDLAYWERQLALLDTLPVNHLSAYCLTVEPGTALAHFVKKGSSQPVNEEVASQQYELLTNWAKLRGWEHYELSNYCKPEHRAVHNSNYWKLKPYLGIGPSAHSYTGNTRHANVASNVRYVKLLEENLPCWEEEVLTLADRYHDWLLTGLRTSDGIQWSGMPDLDFRIKNHFEKEVTRLVKSSKLIKTPFGYAIPPENWLVMDQVLETLFLAD